MTRRLGIGRLAIRHALLAACLGVILGAVFSVQQVRDEYHESVEAERRAIVQMMAVMREPAAQAGYNLNVQAAEVIVKGALSYVPVQEVTLRSDFNETLAQGSNDTIAADAGAWWTRFIAPTQDYVLPLEYGPSNQRVGDLVIVTSQAPRVERFLAAAWEDVAWTLLRSVTVALALGVLSFLTLTRPLTAIARRIGGGPPRQGAAPVAESARRDEIGEIAAAFERYEREADERARSLEASARALAASEVRYRRIVETAGEGVWQLDRDGRTTLANEAMARMLGTSVELLTGRSLYEFVDDADRETAASLLVERNTGDIERMGIRFLRPDGRELWAEVSTCPIADEDGRPAGTLAMVTDATERRRRDEELRATNARLTSMVDDLERHNSDMARIAELNQLLQSARTESEAFDVIRGAAPGLFADTTGGFAVAGTGDDMVVVGAWGAAERVPRSYTRDTCWAIRRGGVHLQSGVRGVRCGHTPSDHTGSMICTPLYVEGKLIGVLHLLGDGDLEALDGSVRQRSELFGEVVKLGLSNLRLRDSLREQALRDFLTGLPNRRLFDETLPRELARCLRSGQPLTLAAIDVDHFKRFNDTYGHDAGDRVLRGVARALVQCIRTSDLASRYGGDEFMCLLPGMTASDAKTRFESALARLAGQSDGADTGSEPVTFTVGLATAPDSGIDVAALLRAADAALYAAKERGRNCVEIAGSACPPAPAPAPSDPVTLGAGS